MLEHRRVFILVASATLLLTSCRKSVSTETPSRTEPQQAAPAQSGPPAVERTCSNSGECAVARIEPSGPHACCPACRTTPGTRAWHADLQRYCAAHPPTNCGPLACPMGPTCAVCRAGVCEATGTDADGGPAQVAVERRCLRAMVCDDWAGCAQAMGNSQDGWFVEQSDRVPKGEIAGLERAAGHDVFRLYPAGVQCPAHTIPPIIPEPGFDCVDKQGRCERRPQ